MSVIKSISNTFEKIVGLPINAAAAIAQSPVDGNPLKKIIPDVKSTASDVIGLPFNIAKDVLIGFVKGTVNLGKDVMLNLPMPTIDLWRRERKDVITKTHTNLEELKSQFA